MVSQQYSSAHFLATVPVLLPALALIWASVGAESERCER